MPLEEVKNICASLAKSNDGVANTVAIIMLVVLLTVIYAGFIWGWLCFVEDYIDNIKYNYDDWKEYCKGEDDFYGFMKKLNYRNKSRLGLLIPFAPVCLICVGLYYGLKVSIKAFRSWPFVEALKFWFGWFFWKPTKLPPEVKVPSQGPYR